VIGKWQAPWGIRGGGSPSVDLPELFPEIVKGLPVYWLQDELVSIQYEGDEIELVGLNCTQ